MEGGREVEKNNTRNSCENKPSKSEKKVRLMKFRSLNSDNFIITCSAVCECIFRPTL